MRDGHNRCYKDTLPDWAMLDGCFGDTKIKVSDLDGWIHQRGKFLFFEKKGPNAIIKWPQLRAFKSMVAQGNSVIAFWCGTPHGKDINSIWTWNIPSFPDERRPGTLDDVRRATAAWFEANRGKHEEVA